MDSDTQIEQLCGQCTIADWLRSSGNRGRENVDEAERAGAGRERGVCLSKLWEKFEVSHQQHNVRRDPELSASLGLSRQF